MFLEVPSFHTQSPSSPRKPQPPRAPASVDSLPLTKATRQRVPVGVTVTRCELDPRFRRQALFVRGFESPQPNFIRACTNIILEPSGAAAFQKVAKLAARRPDRRPTRNHLHLHLATLPVGPPFSTQHSTSHEISPSRPPPLPTPRCRKSFGASKMSQRATQTSRSKCAKVGRLVRTMAARRAARDPAVSGNGFTDGSAMQRPAMTHGARRERR